MASASLERRLGPVDAAAIVIANVVGVGIFTTPAFVATIVPNPQALLAVWVCGGALAFAGSLAYAELAARRPLAGGEYVYVRESFGDLAAFLTGWTSFVAGFSGAIAAGAVGVTVYLDRLVPGIAQSKPLAIAIIVLLAIVHARGLGPGRVVQGALTVLKLGALVAFVGIGFASSAAGEMTPAVDGGPVRMSAFLFAMVPVMFSYSGWNAAAYIAEEIREPSRNVPLGLAVGTVTTVVLYVSLNALYLRSVTPHGVLGPWAEQMFSGVAVVIILSSLNAMTLAGPRVYFAMARNGAFFSAAARVHGRFRTPVVAIAAQAVWSAVLVLSGTFEQLLTYTGFAVILFSGLAVLSLFVLRGRARKAGAFRAWGYPWAPAIFCVVSFAIVANAIVTAPGPALAGLAVILGGLPIYWWTRSISGSPSSRCCR
jgi:basic amino acid/polyamine antiporter, APA family